MGVGHSVAAAAPRRGASALPLSVRVARGWPAGGPRALDAGEEAVVIPRTPRHRGSTRGEWAGEQAGEKRSRMYWSRSREGEEAGELLFE